MKLMIILVCAEKVSEIAKHGSLFSGTTEIASCRVGISSTCLEFLLGIGSMLMQSLCMQ